MSLFRKNNSRHDKLPPIDDSLKQNNRQEVLETIGNLNLSRQQFIVVGSAALTLLDLERQAHDVDLVVHEAIFTDPARLTSGLTVVDAAPSRPELPHWKVGSAPLPSELMSRGDALGVIYGQSQGFEDYIKQNPPHITADGIPIEDPKKIFYKKLETFRTGENRLEKLAQDRYDAELLRQYLQRHS